ncbi:class I SAM-dependent methyltransferase [Allonocardiopsis opalescens]|uniref:class I SAM-dependent methyltransferase n=1 Tax=Allonocardiopsis opalescens TaxID=1144618 RepID=UPI000D04C0FF|nr:class I SAM-dependent methyltransferase [Allonocardiopsis opalescens]
MREALTGAVPSPNIWNSPDVYELENRAFDPDGAVEAAMAEIRPPAGARAVDIGCGTGYHLPGFARRCASVVGVEPHAGLARAARRRIEGLPNAAVRQGTAQRLPLPDASADLAHARWAYFFGPGCEPGLRELERVLARGGTAFIVDNDASTGTFGGWFRRWLPSYDPSAVERFWARQGFQRRPIASRWSFTERAHLEAVLRIEFPAELAARFAAEHRGLEVDYAVNLWWREY